MARNTMPAATAQLRGLHPVIHYCWQVLFDFSRARSAFVSSRRMEERSHSRSSRDLTMSFNWVRFVVALVMSLVMIDAASAIEITLNVVQSQSTIRFRGDNGGTLDMPSAPLLPQDDPSLPTPGITDGDPTRPSNVTTFQGTIKVDVNSVTAPTTIRILEANLVADINGSWLPEVQPNSGGLASDNPPDPAMPGVFGVKLNAFGIDFAYGAVRDMAYNIVTEVDPDGECDNNMCPAGFSPVTEPVNGAGEFSSFSQHVFYRRGFFDTWIDPILDDSRDRDDLTGDGSMNQQKAFDNGTSVTLTPVSNPQKSTYIVSGNTATLAIPINIQVEPGFSQYIDGQFIATYTIAASLPGDYNSNGKVDAADYVLWRDNPSAFGGAAGYNTWRANFGNPPGSGAGLGSGIVPEPAGITLLLFGMAFLRSASRGARRT